MSFSIFEHIDVFELQSKQSLPQLHLAYHHFGKLNASGTNVVWVFHALTANSDPTEWWSGVVGDGCFINPTDYFIICVNIPGSCYGSISPSDINPLTDKPYLINFPLFTIRDIIQAFKLLKNHLGIRSIKIGIGGSMGGQQLLEWAVEEPNLFENIIPIATNAKHSQWGIAFNESQRWAIEQDPSWNVGNINDGESGMKIARSIALLSYRNYSMYKNTDQLENKNAITYQRYQGEKLANRFNAYSYWFLSKSMDLHDLSRKNKSITRSLSAIKANCLVISIISDLLFPVEEQLFLAENIPNAKYFSITSKYGHDGFLIESSTINEIIQSFVNTSFIIDKHLINHRAMKHIPFF